MVSGQLDTVLTHELFADMDQERLRSHLAPLRVRLYGAGDRVAEPGQRRGLLLVLSGRLRTFHNTWSGKRVIFEYIEPGGVDGILSVAGLEGHHTEAVMPSQVLTIGRRSLEEMLAVEPRLAVNLQRVTTVKLRRREEHISRMTMRDPTQRLAAQLLALAGAGYTPRGRVVRTPRISHESLADLIGVRRETVTLHMARLRRMGALGIEEHAFLLNVPLLRALNESQPGCSSAALGQPQDDREARRGPGRRSPGIGINHLEVRPHL